MIWGHRDVCLMRHIRMNLLLLYSNYTQIWYAPPEVSYIKLRIDHT